MIVLVPTEILCAHGSSILWVDYVPTRALGVVKTPLFYAVSLEDSALNIYSPTGRRIMPTITLDAPASILSAAGKYLTAITSTGSVYSW